MPRDLACARCGQLGYRTTGSRPAGEYTCRPCRRAHGPALYRKSDRIQTLVPCAGCERTFMRRTTGHRFCSIACSNRTNNQARARHLEGPRYRRAQREAIAPGLSYTQRKMLAARWRRQRRPCAYCPAPATTMDHVVPLLRGGSNYEGNLVPACRPCNSSKRDHLLVEWRASHAAKLPSVRRAIEVTAA